MPSDWKHTIPDNKDPADQSPRAVLIIDDEATVREAIIDILELEGITVFAAEDGRRGIDMYAKHRERISLVILDLSMPGMSGDETLLKLHAIDPQVRVVLSSGYSASEAEQKIPTSSLVGFLQKPYKVETLLNEIRRLL